MSWRDLCAPLKGYLPDWVIYSLPDGLWLFSLLTILDRVWRGHNAGLPVACFVVIAAVGLELVQMVDPRLGTFDVLDVAVQLTAASISPIGLLLWGGDIGD